MGFKYHIKPACGEVNAETALHCTGVEKLKQNIDIVRVRKSSKNEQVCKFTIMNEWRMLCIGDVVVRWNEALHSCINVYNNAHIVCLGCCEICSVDS